MNFVYIALASLFILYLVSGLDSIETAIYRLRMPIEEGDAARIIFWYPGEEGTFVENVYVEVYPDGVVTFENDDGRSTTNLKNCEILWSFRDAQPTLPGSVTPQTGNVVSLRKK